jgi:hypothetical protein
VGHCVSRALGTEEGPEGPAPTQWRQGPKGPVPARQQSVAVQGESGAGTHAPTQSRQGLLKQPGADTVAEEAICLPTPT